jgi:hypothetical protein
MVNFFVTNPKSATELQNLLIAYCWSLGDSHWIRGRRNLRPSMTSICYIVPSYTPNEASHMAHLPRFLSEVGKYCDLHVIIQRGREQPKIPDVRSVYVQRPGNHFQRAVELIQVAYRLRQQGCCKFFVRISASAAFVLGLVGRVLGLQIYYWVSGQGKMKPQLGVGVQRIKL